MKIIYGIDFSNGKNGGPAGLCAALAAIAAFMTAFVLLEGREGSGLYALIFAAAAFVLALCSLLLFRRRHTKRRN